MLVDNPKRLFKSLYMLKNQTFSREEYRPILASLTRKGKIHSKTRDTYFYTATILNLIKETNAKSHRYTVTPMCRKICQVMSNKSEEHRYKKYLKGLLLSNKDKGPLFRRFLSYTSKPKAVAQIQNEFGKVPTKTLIAFCIEAGLIVRYRGLVKSVEIKSSATVPDFYSSLVKVYRNLQVEAKRPLQMIYIPVDLIRDMVCLDMGLESSDLFDELFEKTIDSELGVTIYLHGAPPQVEKDFLYFSHNGRRYAFMSMRLKDEPGD